MNTIVIKQNLDNGKFELALSSGVPVNVILTETSLDDAQDVVIDGEAHVAWSVMTKSDPQSVEAIIETSPHFSQDPSMNGSEVDYFQTQLSKYQNEPEYFALANACINHVSELNDEHLDKVSNDLGEVAEELSTNPELASALALLKESGFDSVANQILSLAQNSFLFEYHKSV